MIANDHQRMPLPWLNRLWLGSSLATRILTIGTVPAILLSAVVIWLALAGFSHVESQREEQDRRQLFTETVTLEGRLDAYEELVLQLFSTAVVGDMLALAETYRNVEHIESEIEDELQSLTTLPGISIESWHPTAVRSRDLILNAADDAVAGNAASSSDSIATAFAVIGEFRRPVAEYKVLYLRQHTEALQRSIRSGESAMLIGNVSVAVAAFVLVLSWFAIRRMVHEPLDSILASVSAISKGIPPHFLPAPTGSGDILEQTYAALRLLAANDSLRRKAETRLRESEARLRDYAEVSAEWFWETDIDLEFTYVSPGIAKVLEIDQETAYSPTGTSMLLAALGSTPLPQDLSIPDNLQSISDFIFSVEVGEKRVHLCINGRPVHGPDGEFLGYRGTGYSYSGQMQLILEQLRAREAAEAALRIRSGYEALSRAIGRLTEDWQVREFISAVLQEMLSGIGGDEALGFHVDSATETVRLTATARAQKASASDDSEEPSDWHPLVENSNCIYSLFATNKPLVLNTDNWVNSVTTSFIAWHRERGHNTVVCIPSFRGVSLCGFVMACFQERRSFSAEELEALSIFGKHASLALTLEVLSVRAADAAVAEDRNRVAYDLHDTLAQSLTGMSVQLQLAKDLLSADPRMAGTWIDRALELARNSIGQTRRIVFHLLPGTERYSNLGLMLQELIAENQPGTGVTMQVTVDGEERKVDPNAGVQLVRVAQEAITNTLRHARARNLGIAIRYRPDRVGITVVDDGVGFDDTRQDLGFGLESMRRRMERIGGVLTIRSTPGKGTAVDADTDG